MACCSTIGNLVQMVLIDALTYIFSHYAGNPFLNVYCDRAITNLMFNKMHINVQELLTTLVHSKQ